MRFYDCCDKSYKEGDIVTNVGDSIDVIIFCKEHAPVSKHPDIPSQEKHVL